jgi:hypothetical protein
MQKVIKQQIKGVENFADNVKAYRQWGIMKTKF